MTNSGEIEKCKCGSTKMRVETSHSCGLCMLNGFCLDPELAEKLGVEEKFTYYDERLRKDAGHELGKEVKRTECEDDGECNMGSNWNAGCSLYVCANCGDTVGFVAFVDGC